MQNKIRRLSGLGLRHKVRRLARLGAILLVASGIGNSVHGADITWDTPRLLRDESDVITTGTLDRAYVMGFGRDEITVNGVVFTRFGKNRPIPRDSLRLEEDRTAFVTSGDTFEPIDVLPNAILPELSGNYRILLQSGIRNHGAPWTLFLNGLIPGRTYHLQCWLRDPMSPMTSQVLTAGTSSSQVASRENCSLLGTFVADNPSQTIIQVPVVGPAQINAFQIRIDDNSLKKLTIVKPPGSSNARLGQTVQLSVFAKGQAPVSYQWVKKSSTNALADNDQISGSKSPVLQISNLRPQDAGDYQVVVSHGSVSVTSACAAIRLLTNQLINIAARSDEPLSCTGKAVLTGAAVDRWNVIDCRTNRADIALVNAAGTPVPVTFTLEKTNGSALPHGLLGGISFGAYHTVTLKNLDPNTYYDLVVFSVGAQLYEGGFFAGALSGFTRGYPVIEAPNCDFLNGVNYVRNPYARTDSKGTLTFSILPNTNAISNGYENCDFNGLQVQKVPSGPAVPVIVQQPGSATAHIGQKARLSALVVSPPGLNTIYSWESLDPNGKASVWEEDVPGKNSEKLIFERLRPEDSGIYRLVAKNAYGATTSQVASVSVFTNQLINVALTQSAPTRFRGQAVLPGTPEDFWTGVNAQGSFSNIPLMDSTGQPTLATLSLKKNRSEACPHSLLGTVSYSSQQVVTISNLAPDSVYHLVVFSVGGEAYEGGVFSGAISGVTRGYPRGGIQPTNFVAGTNYIENPLALTDGNGTLSFTIKPNSTAFPGGFNNCDFNGLQLTKATLPTSRPLFVQHPPSVRALTSQTITLSGAAASPLSKAPHYQWQKIVRKTPIPLTNDASISGAHSNVLCIRQVTPPHAGDYQLLASDESGTTISRCATVTILSNQTINVAVTAGNTTSFKGVAVLPGSEDDVWAWADCRGSVSDMALVDTTGAPVPVTFTLSKPDGDATGHSLLGNVSFGSMQTITLKNLLPDSTYHLVAFSVGGQANEGGVFSGAIKGITRGYPQAGISPTQFHSGTNYVENVSTRTDREGTLRFTITPTDTIVPGGYHNCVFNGLQITRVSPR